MASHQEALRDAWLGGRVGSLSALAQAKAWALREVWQAEKTSNDGLLSCIAERVEKVGGGVPHKGTMSEFFANVDADPAWFPGKSSQERFGLLPVLNGTKRKLVARSAMAMAQRGEEPTYPALVAANPKALLNPATGEPVGNKIVYDILRAECYADDDDPDGTWAHRTRCSKVALTSGMISMRQAWALWMKAQRLQPTWLYQRLVWTGICSSILPRTEKRHAEMVLARKGRKGWTSKKTAKRSAKLRGNVSAIKQSS